MAKYTIHSNAYIYLGCLIVAVVVLLTTSSPKTILKHAAQSFGADSLQDIRNATLGFQKIFVINLPSRTDNRDAITLAAAVTGLDLEFIDGVTDVLPKFVPGGQGDKFKPGELGNWRAHMNVARRMVEDNIASALVLEDDADWDLRIKDQMEDFAKAARLLLQPRSRSKDEMLDPTYPTPGSDDTPSDFFIDRSPLSKPRTSPYADIDNWDLFWLGHCGAFFPSAAKTPNRPIGRAVILDDETVPEPQHIGIMIGNDDLEKEYPPHTRVVSRANRNTCTFGYALSLQGARRVLYEFGVRKMHEATDIAFRSFCDGDDRILGTCLTVQPELIGQHRPAGSKSAFSEIESFDDSVNEQAFTRNIRWSTRMNMQKVLEGDSDYIDLYQDGQPAVDRGWGRGP